MEVKDLLLKRQNKRQHRENNNKKWTTIERPESNRMDDYRRGLQVAAEIKIRREGQRCWRCVQRLKIDHLLIKADESNKKKIEAAAGLAIMRQEL